MIKNSFIYQLNQSISYPESRLAAGLVVAGKQALPKNIQTDFQKSGTLQVVVLSGYNVTIIAEAIFGLFAFLPILFSSFLSIISIIGFTIMAGGSATIVRGSCMAIIVVLGKLLRRQYNVLRALIVTGIGMLIINPMLLIFDPSFQLSFLATLGLILLTPHIEKYLLWLPDTFKIREVCSATVAAQIFVTPYLLWAIGSLSLVSLPANFLLSLLVPTTMLLCFTTGILAFISSFITWPSAFLSTILLHIELGIVHVSSSLPFGFISSLSFPTWCLGLCYGSYAVIIWRLSQHETTKLPNMPKINFS